MRIIYSPEGGDSQSWVFDGKCVRQTDAALIEKAYGKPYQQFVAEAQGGSIRALRVLIWHLLRTTSGHVTYRLEDVPDFFVGEVEVKHSAAELREGRANLLAANVDEAERGVMLAQIDGQIAVAEAEEATAQLRSETVDATKNDAAGIGGA